MAKEKQKERATFTLSFDVIEYLNVFHSENKSDFIENLIKDYRNKQTNFRDEIKVLNKETIELSERREKIYYCLKKQIEEGNKEEREEAEKMLAKLKEDEKEKLKEALQFVKQVEGVKEYQNLKTQYDNGFYNTGLKVLNEKLYFKELFKVVELLNFKEGLEDLKLSHLDMLIRKRKLADMVIGTELIEGVKG